MFQAVHLHQIDFLCNESLADRRFISRAALKPFIPLRHVRAIVPHPLELEAVEAGDVGSVVDISQGKHIAREPWSAGEGGLQVFGMRSCRSGGGRIMGLRVIPSGSMDPMMSGRARQR